MAGEGQPSVCQYTEPSQPVPPVPGSGHGVGSPHGVQGGSLAAVSLTGRCQRVSSALVKLPLPPS